MIGTRHAPDAADSRLAMLQRQMRQGWQIESPVIERAVVHTSSGSGRAYEVVLCNQQTRQVLALPDTPIVRDFMARLNIAIVEI